MAANVLPYHNANPYYSEPVRQHFAIFSAQDYELNLLVRTLSPIALRVMIILASRLTSEGYAKASLDELSRIIRTPRSFVNKGLIELAQYSVITKKKQSEYWLNPNVFRSIVAEISR